MKRYDTRTYYHTLNVSILAMYFSAKMGFAREEVLDIGIAGLFHDIGKIYISRKIIQKPSRLTDEEFAKMKNHVIVGTEILLKYVEAVGFLPVVTCFEHHLKYDMSGYPKLTFTQPPHLASEITTICDVYDALSQRRSYKDDYPPSQIYEVMLKEKGTTFEPELLGKFFRIMGVWPVGAIVSLTDARIAVVREENEDDIFSPKVEVIMPIDRKETIDLRITRDTNKIERYLNPFNEGKEYLHLV
jgi:putative nucleotidyltransferase with HDIG domain